jgi:hypothetical protein
VRLRTLSQTLLVGAASALCVLSSSADALSQQPPAAPAEPSEKDVQTAQLHFKKGNDFFTMKKFSLALDEFKKSYAAVASPNSRLYIARSLVQLGEHVDAYLEFDGVIAEAEARSKTEPKYAPTRETAMVERDEVGNKIALVTVNVTNDAPDAKLLIGGKEIPRERWGKPHPVAPGETEVVLETPAKPPVKEALTLKAGDKRPVALDANAAATPPPGGGGAGETGGGAGETGGGGDTGSTGGPGMTKLRPFAFVAAGVGVAGLATFAIAGIMSNSTYSDLEAMCGTSPCPPELADDVSTGKTQQTIANIGLVVGAIGVAAAVPLFILSSGKKSDDAPPPAEARVVIAPGYLGLHGRF